MDPHDPGFYFRDNTSIEPLRGDENNHHGDDSATKLARNLGFHLKPVCGANSHDEVPSKV